MIELISAISFSFACLNLLLTGFSKLDERRRLASTYKERLELHKALLYNYKIHLQQWDDIWGEFDESDYQLFFGESRDTIKNLFNNVAILATNIKRSLQGHEEESLSTSKNIGADDSKKWLADLKKIARNISKSITH